MVLANNRQAQDLQDPEMAVARIREILSSHHRFLICGHVRPDGDCIGSGVALASYLRDAGKEVRFHFCEPIPESFRDALPGMEHRDAVFPGNFNPEVMLCLDCGSIDRICDDFVRSGLIVNIDHHHGNSRFGDLNWIDSSFAAVGEMIFLLLEPDFDRITPDIATALYLAIVTDTGAFRYSNTSARSLRTAALLVERGASPSGIASLVWGNRKLETCLIAAAVWNDLHFEADGRFVWSEIRQTLFNENGGEQNEPDNLVSELAGLSGVQVAIMFRERVDGGMRVSLRSRGPVDASAVAAQLGGGGHRSAAGLELSGPYETARQRVIDATLQHIAKH